ncbi:hypothetical protein HDU82_001382 [Entophlyctis luteolus]|nr:hypothetical protein HDU82_001382 [Entophlyctis luteolus]
MGRLKIFNRRIALAPDDVYVPAAYAVILHSIWLASIAVVYAVIRNDCNISPVLLDFLLTLLVTLSVQVPLDIAMMGLSMSGTVGRKGPRRYVGAVVQFSAFVLAWELLLECFGMYAAFGPQHYLEPYQDPTCTSPMDPSSPVLVHMVVLWSMVAILFYFLTMAVLLANSERKSGSKLDEYIKIWQGRLNFIVGSAALVDSDVLRDVATELASYFKDFDWAASDVAVGLLLLKREQKKIIEIRQARRILIEQPEGFLVPALDDQKVREELARVQREEESRRMLLMNGGRIGSGVGKFLKGGLKIMYPNNRPNSNVFAVSGVLIASPPSDKMEQPGEEAILPGMPMVAEPEDDVLPKIQMAKIGSALTSPPRSPDHQIPLRSKEVESDEGEQSDANAKVRSKFSISNLRSPSFKVPVIHNAASPRSKSQIRSSKPKAQFQPFQFRKKRQMGNHRSKKVLNHGTVFREEIDDILYFARYAEVVYTPEEINMIYSDRLHFHATDNGIYRSPYLIVHDVETDSIVIAIRGTYSAADVLVDLKFDVTKISIPDCEGDDDHLAHSGFLNTAMNIVGDIKRLNILHPLLNDPNSEFYGFSLVVTGHSLGAGVAALVANMLREDFPSTCCYAFEPPGCIVSARAAEHFESFCTSIVMGDDVVTRLSRNTLEMLKMDIARHIANCDLPKWKVFGSVLADRLLCISGKNSTSVRRRGARSSRPGLLHRRTPSGHLIPEDLAKLKRRTNSLRAGKNGEENPFADFQLPTPPMYIPGRILHMEKLRRPPLNMNQIMGRQINKVKEATKAVGNNIRAGAEGIVDFMYEGAEKIKGGVGEIGDFILDGAEDIKDAVLDGADKLLVNTSRVIGGPSGSDPALDAADVDLPAQSELFGRKPSRRAGSLGNILTANFRAKDDIDDASPKSMGHVSPVDVDRYSPTRDAKAGKGVVIEEPVKQKEERKSRRRQRKLDRARSAGNIRSRSTQRVADNAAGFETGAEESGASSNDEEENHRRGRSGGRFGQSRSKTQKDFDGTATDTEVFSDNELAELGETRPDGKQSVPGIGKDYSNRSGANGSKPKRSNSKSAALGLKKSSEALGSNTSFKPRAHKDAVPSESISGRVVPVGESQFQSSTPITSPQVNPSIPTTKSASTPVETTVRMFSNTGELNAIYEEESDLELTMPSKVNGPSRSILLEEPQLSKPQYPPTGKIPGAPAGPNIHGKYHYVPRWARKEEFQEIIVSRSMIADHSPFDMLREFQAAPPGSVLGLVTRN